MITWTPLCLTSTATSFLRSWVYDENDDLDTVCEEVWGEIKKATRAASEDDLQIITAKGAIRLRRCLQKALQGNAAIFSTVDDGQLMLKVEVLGKVAGKGRATGKAAGCAGRSLRQLHHLPKLNAPRSSTVPRTSMFICHLSWCYALQVPAGPGAQAGVWPGRPAVAAQQQCQQQQQQHQEPQKDQRLRTSQASCFQECLSCGRSTHRLCWYEHAHTQLWIWHTMFGHRTVRANAYARASQLKARMLQHSAASSNSTCKQQQLQELCRCCASPCAVCCFCPQQLCMHCMHTCSDAVLCVCRRS